MDISEQLFMSTIQIVSKNNLNSSTGTGFFFRFDNIRGTCVDTIVTNKHVVDSFDTCTLNLRSKLDNSIIPVTINANLWILHNQLDLAVLPMDRIYMQYNNLNIYTKAFTKSHIPPSEYLSKLSCIEDVLMMGYPDSIIDLHNNLPVVRKGITATPVKYNFQGDPAFLIDSSVYGGSSGSPVFIYNKNGYTKDGKFINKPQVILLGINHKVFLHNTHRFDLYNQPIHIENGLGIVIKSSCLFDFKKLL